eukprot:gb/GEZN01002276.1/.p1 GENE.gb/GEZN01002276.1/~~gb/GEZN01002276.1/.p1  ORF type:complete len:751 (-),score=111.68 gb/GEZN01002276.1/:302-2518(-)
MATRDYVMLGERPGSSAILRPIRIAINMLGLAFVATAGWAAKNFLQADFSSNTAGSSRSGREFIPADGVEKLTLRPGPMGLPLMTRGLPGPFAIFLYESSIPKSLSDGTSTEAWVYGAKIVSKDTQHQVNVALPTGIPEDVLKGTLLVWPADSFPEKLRGADQLMGYSPANPLKGLVQRSVVSTVKADGATARAYFYYVSKQPTQAPPSEETTDKETDQQDAPARQQSMQATAKPTSDYSKLCSKLQEINVVGGIGGLLGWDEQVMMPQGAAALRAKQSAMLAGVLYEKSADKELGALIAKLEANPPTDVWQAAVVRDAARDYKKVIALSKDLAQREATLQSQGYQTWVEARRDSDFPKFAPILNKWIALTKEKNTAIAPTKDLYDTAIDTFERGMTAKRLDEIFTEVREGLVPLLKDLDKRGKAPDNSWLSGTFDVNKQAALCNEIALDLGFDLERGRLDVSVHPFTGGSGPTDVRMTTRFKEHDLSEGITGAIHETGHALYEQGRNQAYDCLPVSEALSMGVHESQSLLWERCVALSLPFAHYLLPKLQKAFPQLPQDKTPYDLYLALNRISTDRLIRVEADEVTYPLHIVLRYELESALIKGELDVADLPKLWNEKMKTYLGVTVPNNTKGVLQDVHWPGGAFGYFPSYSLGAMMAVQIFQAAKQAIPTLDQDIAAGRFQGLRNWLRVAIHEKGSLYPTADELMVSATGQPLRPAVFLEYLSKKYGEIYFNDTSG